jgi:hypothetical protein
VHRQFELASNRLCVVAHGQQAQHSHLTLTELFDATLHAAVPFPR